MTTPLKTKTHLGNLGVLIVVVTILLGLGLCWWAALGSVSGGVIGASLATLFVLLCAGGALIAIHMENNGSW